MKTRASPFSGGAAHKAAIIGRLTAERDPSAASPHHPSPPAPPGTPRHSRPPEDPQHSLSDTRIICRPAARRPVPSAPAVTLPGANGAVLAGRASSAGGRPAPPSLIPFSRYRQGSGPMHCGRTAPSKGARAEFHSQGLGPLQLNKQICPIMPRPDGR